MTYSVLLVDDHKIMRDGIKAILEHGSEFTVSAEAGNGADAVEICKSDPPDLVLMDIALPGMNGIEATTEILRQCPGTKVVVLSIYDDEDSVIAAIRAGARGFVPKLASAGDLLDALRTVATGGSYLSSQVSDHLLAHVRRGELESKTPGLVDPLSPKEVQILRMVAEGKTSKEIATILDLGVQSVRGIRRTLMKKIGVTNVAGLTKVALTAGLTGGVGPERKKSDS